MQPSIDQAKDPKECSHVEINHLAGEKQAVEIAPAPIGRTSRPVYISVVLTSLLMLTMMVTAIAHGGIAVAAAIPAGLFVNQTIGATTLTNTSIHVAIADHGIFLFTRTNVVATDVTITIKINVPLLGPIMIKQTIARLAINGLVAKTTIPSVTPSSLLDLDLLWNSATLEGVTITIIRP